MSAMFFHKLNRLFKNYGTWTAVAKAIGINDRTLRRYWEGSRTPSMQTYRRVLAAK